eukprot:scaffold27684_cov52-Phaeocystis_antarctica.AAC.6
MAPLMPAAAAVPRLAAANEYCVTVDATGTASRARPSAVSHQPPLVGSASGGAGAPAFILRCAVLSDH